MSRPKQFLWGAGKGEAARRILFNFSSNWLRGRRGLRCLDQSQRGSNCVDPEARENTSDQVANYSWLASHLNFTYLLFPNEIFFVNNFQCWIPLGWSILGPGAFFLTNYDSYMVLYFMSNKLCNFNENLFNLLTPMSDQGRISPYNINTISCWQVMRIKKNIN